MHGVRVSQPEVEWHHGPLDQEADEDEHERGDDQRVGAVVDELDVQLG